MAARIRAYDPSDFDALWRMDGACYAPEVAYSKRTMRAFLRLPGAECLVAEYDGAILGFVMTDGDGAAGHVITLDVSPEARRRGIGTALVEAAHASLAARGVREVELETSTSNRTGIAFWEHHGYRTGGLLPKFYENGEDAFWMSRRIGRAASA